jgi:hypothetical protein
MGDNEEKHKTDLVAATSNKGLPETTKPEEEPEPAVIPGTKDTPLEITKQVQAFWGTQSVGPAPNQLISKFTAAHIDKYLDYMQRDYDHEHEMAASNRWFFAFYFVIGVIVLAVAVVYLLPRDRDFLVSIIQFLVLIGGGIGAGYGLSKRGKR